jgi:hypothetical protein
MEAAKTQNWAVEPQGKKKYIYMYIYIVAYENTRKSNHILSEEQIRLLVQNRFTVVHIVTTVY